MASIIRIWSSDHPLRRNGGRVDRLLDFVSTEVCSTCQLPPGGFGLKLRAAAGDKFQAWSPQLSLGEPGKQQA